MVDRSVTGVVARSVVLFGVSGCGKTAVGERVAPGLGLRFVDADDHHPESNVRKMAAGEPLDDDDREPWLERLAELLREADADRAPVVLACSALKQHYRDTLREGAPVVMVLLDIPPAVARERVDGREGHFMPSSLVDSQFEALQRPTDALVVDAVPPLDQVVSATADAVRRATAGAVPRSTTDAVPRSTTDAVPRDARSDGADRVGRLEA